MMSNSNAFKWFQTTVRDLSPSLFNMFLEQTKTNALEGLIGIIAVGGRKQLIRFEDDIDLILRSKENLHILRGD